MPITLHHKREPRVIRTVFKAFGRQHMHVALRTGQGLRVQIIERPGLWMSPDDLFQLSENLKTIAEKTLPRDGLTYGVFSADATRMADSIITLGTRADGTPIAFNALAIMQIEMEPRPIEVLHLGLVMVDPDERSKNLSWVLYGLTCFLIFLRRQFRPIWISNVTQVPAVVGMVSTLFSDVWPQPEGGRRTLNHLLIARRIMDHHRHVFGVGPEAGFYEDRFVIINAYTGGSDGLKKPFEEAAKHREDRFNTFCADQLDYDRGDDLIQLGQMDLTAVRGYLAREVPRSQLFGVLLTGALLAIRRLILPVLHWSNSQEAWNDLRPAKTAQDMVKTP